MDFLGHIRQIFSTLMSTSSQNSKRIEENPSVKTETSSILSQLKPSNEVQACENGFHVEGIHPDSNGVGSFRFKPFRNQNQRLETLLRPPTQLSTSLTSSFAADRPSTLSQNFKRAFNNTLHQDEHCRNDVSSLGVNSSKLSLWSLDAPTFVPPPRKRSRLIDSNSLANRTTSLTHRPKEKSLYADILRLYTLSNDAGDAQTTSQGSKLFPSSVGGGAVRTRSRQHFHPYLPLYSRQKTNTSVNSSHSALANVSNDSVTISPLDLHHTNQNNNGHEDHKNSSRINSTLHNSSKSADGNAFISKLHHYTSSLMERQSAGLSSHSFSYLHKPRVVSTSTLLSNDITLSSEDSKDHNLSTLIEQSNQQNDENYFPRKDTTDALSPSSSSENGNNLVSSEGSSHESDISPLGSPQAEHVKEKSTNTAANLWRRPSETFCDKLEQGDTACQQILQKFDWSTARNLQRWSESEMEYREAAKFWSLKNAERLAKDVEKISKRLSRIMRERPDYDSMYLSSLPELEPEVEEEEEELLPELTSQIQHTIRDHLKHHDDTVVVEAFRLTICVRDLRTLCGLNWLSDQVINYYMQLIQNRSETAHTSGNTTLPKVVVVSTFFYSKLCDGGYSGIRRWTRTSNIFKKDLLFVPIHLGVHWCMLCVNIKKKTVTFYDSMGNKNDRCLAIIRDFLVQEAADKENIKLDINEWSFINAQRECPQQENGSDCGVFSCICAEYLSRSRPLTYTQSQMPYFRQRMMYEIISKRFM